VLALEDPASGAYAEILETVIAARDTDRCDTIVLGCAGMTDLAARLSAETRLPVVDGVGCAVKLIETLVALNLTTAHFNGYSPPRPKPYMGRFADYSFG
jgi:allantoin racemase